MGMFDELRCHVALPDEEGEALRSAGHTYQTKDLDCQLDLHEITAEGRLVRLEWNYAEKLWHSPVDLNYHGMLNFYTLTMDKRWFEYDAKFTDGKVTEIQGGKRP